VLVALLRNNIASNVEDMMSHGIMYMVNVAHFPLLKDKLWTHFLGAGTVFILRLQSKVLNLRNIEDQQMSFYNCNFIVLCSTTWPKHRSTSKN